MTKLSYLIAAILFLSPMLALTASMAMAAVTTVSGAAIIPNRGALEGQSFTSKAAMLEELKKRGRK